MPPPPPPAPPPAPKGLPKVPKVTSSGKDSGRSALLSSIQGGAKLKKSVTNDRSAPAVSGNNKKAAPPSSIGRSNNNGPSPAAPVGLGGLFDGGIPRLPFKGGNTGPPKRVSGPGKPFKPPTQQSNGRVLNGGQSAPPPPPPPSQLSKPSRPVSNTSIGRKESVQNERNLEHSKPNHLPAPWNASRTQPPPPPSRPAPSSSNRPSSMVGRPLPPTPPTSSELPVGPPRVAPPPPPRQTSSGPPGRPSAPPPPVRTTSAQSGGTIGRSGMGTVRPHLPPRQDPPPPPPPHTGHSIPNHSSSAPGANAFTDYNLEQKFKFHSVNEFPPPEKLNINMKSYPSKIIRKNSSQQRREPPPPPPPR